MKFEKKLNKKVAIFSQNTLAFFYNNNTYTSIMTWREIKSDDCTFDSSSSCFFPSLCQQMFVVKDLLYTAHPFALIAFAMGKIIHYLFLSFPHKKKSFVIFSSFKTMYKRKSFAEEFFFRLIFYNFFAFEFYVWNYCYCRKINMFSQHEKCIKYAAVSGIKYFFSKFYVKTNYCFYPKLMK